jgi:hypothetical protein
VAVNAIILDFVKKTVSYVDVEKAKDAATPKAGTKVSAQASAPPPASAR